jgi:tetratricopeptide (TPR) repeat protein
MEQIEKTVFISYRRTNLPWALAMYQYLTANKYDVFFDYNSIKSGAFEKIITQNVKGRAHFVVLLTPSALERSNEPGDWLRYEVELAIDSKRNIVPLFFEGFSFSTPSVSKYLTGKLEILKKYNGMTVPSEYFEAAMERLCNDFLNIPLSAVLHPSSKTVDKALRIQQSAANNATKVEQQELTAQEWLEQGFKHLQEKNFDEAIHCNTKAISLKPNFALAYVNRAAARVDKNDFDGGINDCNEAMRLDPKIYNPYYI